MRKRIFFAILLVFAGLFVTPTASADCTQDDPGDGVSGQVTGLISAGDACVDSCSSDPNSPEYDEVCPVPPPPAPEPLCFDALGDTCRAIWSRSG